jgi:hypothetical protein
MTASLFGAWKMRIPLAAGSLFLTPRRLPWRGKFHWQRQDQRKGAVCPLDERRRPHLFGKYSGTEIKIDDEDFIIMREEEVLGVLGRG